MAPFAQPLDRALPLRPTRRHPEARLHIRRALARPEPKTVGLGLARRAVHPVGDRGKEGAPALAGTCLRVACWIIRSIFLHTV
jgi:hypothetical protein